MANYIRLPLLALLVVVAGCAKSPVAVTSVTSEDCFYVVASGRRKEVCRIVIDGKQCLITPGGYAGGITCNWKEPANVE